MSDLVRTQNVGFLVHRLICKLLTDSTSPVLALKILIILSLHVDANLEPSVLKDTLMHKSGNSISTKISSVPAFHINTLLSAPVKKIKII